MGRIALGLRVVTALCPPIHPARLALWSFLAAMAHGAGLMLNPIFLGTCAVGAEETSHAAAQSLMGNKATPAFIVAFVHTFSMTIAGAVVALIIYLWLGSKFLSKTWFNFDLVWALSLILVGAFGVASAYLGH